MNELKKYLSPTVLVVALESKDVITFSNAETNDNNDNVWDDVYD